MAYEVHHRLLSYRANCEPEEPFPTNSMEDPSDLDEVVKLCNPVVVPAFGSSIVKGRTAETMMMTMKLNVMTQAPYAEDEANLPIGLYVLRMRCDMDPGSRMVNLVLWNGTTRPIKLSPG